MKANLQQNSGAGLGGPAAGAEAGLRPSPMGKRPGSQAASQSRPEDTASRPGPKRPRRDLRFRLAYTKPELSLLLPFGHTTLEEMIKRGTFPDGLRAHPTAHKIWPRRVIEEWLEKTQGRGAAG